MVRPAHARETTKVGLEWPVVALEVAAHASKACRRASYQLCQIFCSKVCRLHVLLHFLDEWPKFVDGEQAVRPSGVAVVGIARDAHFAGTLNLKVPVPGSDVDEA